MMVSVAALLGWWLDLPLLRTGFGIGVAMNPATAVCFLLAGVGLWAVSRDSSTAGWRTLGRVLRSAVSLLAGLKLGEHVWGWPVAVDQVLFASRLEPTAAGLPNRMAPNTAACFLLIGLALLVVEPGSRRRLRAGQFLALGAAWSPSSRCSATATTG